jgi:hypothetical protein
MNQSLNGMVFWGFTQFSLEDRYRSVRETVSWISRYKGKCNLHGKNCA